MPHRNNSLLNRLEPAVLDRLQPYFTIADLHQGAVLAETNQRIEKVYFPHAGIISCVVELIGGGAIETGMIGNDGAFGAAQALDGKVSLNHVVMQVPGAASLIASDEFRKVANEVPAFRGLLIRYEQFFLAQVQQTAACNAVHQVRARTCKWLLRMHELSGPELPLTQEFMAQMMGVRRGSITTVAQELQNSGMITYRRGRVQITNLDLIKQSACECNEDVRSHYRRLFNSNEGFSDFDN
jgi:CRP-like cAMP-binding protein